jgi:hypothetical protein
MRMARKSRVLIGLLMVLFLSCTKENVRKYRIEGIWVGTYTVDGLPTQGALFNSFSIYPDGTMLTKGKGGDGADHFSKGTWNLASDTLFTATITTFYPNFSNPITQRIQATFSKEGILTNGTWTDTINPYGLKKGKYSGMQRVD